MSGPQPSGGGPGGTQPPSARRTLSSTSSTGNETEREDSRRHAAAAAPSDEHAALSTTPTQSHVARGTLSAMPREPSVSWSQHGSEPSHAGAGSTIGRGSAPQQRPSASLTPRSSSVRRDPSSAARSTSYAPSDIDTVSAVSASEFSSGEEDAGGRTAQSATLRGRAPQQAGTGRAETGPVSVSLSRATGASTASRAGNRRASVVRDARRGSVARRNSDEDEDRFGPLDDEDDEVEHLDRGEELVRRRMKARQKEKAARRKKEKAVERERLRAQQGSVASQNVPASPGGQGPRSPTLEREGRPTYIAMPTPSSEVGPGTLSPGLSSAGGLPALSPGIYRGPTTYPSPHSHIRRPSHNQQQPQSQLGGRRMSGAQASGASTVTRAPGAGGLDVFSDAGAAPSEVPASSVAGSVVDGGDDEERDTVAGLATEAARTEAGSRLGDEVDVAHEEEEDDDDEATPSGSGGEDDVEYTLKDRQDAINIEHPFGLPIWKPALYKKSRTVTRNAESALHSTPSAAAGRHLLPGNLLWTLLFGSWLCVLCLAAALLLVVVPVGGARYGRVLWELGCYLLWPFGKYVEIDVSPTSGERGVSWVEQPHDAEVAYENAFTPVAARFPHDHAHRIPFNSRGRSGDYSDYNAAQPDGTVRASSRAAESGEASGSGSASGSGTETGAHDAAEGPGSTLSARSAQAIAQGPGETSPLKGKARAATYGATADSEEGGSSNSGGGARKEDRVSEELDVYEYVHDDQGRDVGRRGRIFGTLAFGLLFWLVVAPLMGLVCLALWGMVFTIPMAKLTWVLLKNLSSQPLALHFRSAPGNALSANHDEFGATAEEDDSDGKDFLRPLRPGQFAPRPKARRDGERQRRSKILLCTYRAMGLQYYKYTVGGVNILFVNTLPFVFFTIFDFFFVEAYVHRHHITTGFLAAISSQGALFVFALGSVLPLSYFIGMAVASISAQSSIGMGAVINATFGSIVEIILYAIALTQNKARLVEGSLVGSILAGVLLMPGLSMCSGATRRKEQRFNARSAGVTSTMLIMAIIGILTPTMFYQIYGTFHLTCTGCPSGHHAGDTWSCKRCFYEHIPPATDPFYQENVKGLMYTCTVVLVLSYAIGLWFSLRTHASQIWQNPNPVPAPHGAAPSAHVYHTNTGASTAPGAISIPGAQRASIYKRLLPSSVVQQLLPTQRPTSQANSQAGGTLRSQRGAPGDLPPLQLPEGLSQEEYARAVALTTSAFMHGQQHQHQQQQAQQQQQQQQQQTSQLSANQAIPRSTMHEPAPRHVSMHEAHDDGGGHGGHDAPSWTRNQSLIVLLSCTVLYAIIAEILVDAVDVVLDGSGIDIKLLGVTLFALVPNATEFMNAMSFAINGNIALSMEIGSAYALQVCLIQIPAMVAFSAWYNHDRAASALTSFSLIFPRWDVIAVIFSVFLLTYTYTEARSNYYRGSILILSYVVLVSGFVFAPSSGDTEDPGEDGQGYTPAPPLSFALMGGSFGGSPVPALHASSQPQHALTPAFSVLAAMFQSLWAR